MNRIIFVAASPLLIVGLLQPPPTMAQATPAAERHSASEADGTARHQHRRGPKKFMLANAQEASILLWKPDLSTVPLTIEHGSITLPFTGVDNYHALVVRKDWGHLQETLIRYEYLQGKPSGHSTSELTRADKSNFEIVPDPVPENTSTTVRRSAGAFCCASMEHQRPICRCAWRHRTEPN